MAQLRSKVTLFIVALCLGVVGLMVANKYQLYFYDMYVALPFLLSDRIRGDTFPDQEERLALAERVSLPQNGSDIFMSVLATHKYHDKRLSRLFVTWMQTVDPKQVSQARVTWVHALAVRYVGRTMRIGDSSSRCT